MGPNHSTRAEKVVDNHDRRGFPHVIGPRFKGQPPDGYRFTHERFSDNAARLLSFLLKMPDNHIGEERFLTFVYRFY